MSRPTRLIRLLILCCLPALALPACSPTLTTAQSRNELLRQAAAERDYDQAAALIKKGTDVNAADIYGRTPLHYAAWGNSPKIAALLIDNDAQPDAVVDAGKTPLHYAVMRDADAVAGVLIDLGADPNVVDDYGWTPLHYAAWVNALRAAPVLLEKNAYAFPRNNVKDTPSELARRKQHWGVVKLLEDARP